MATHQSAVKRHRQNLKHRARNNDLISRMKTQIKGLRALIRDRKVSEAVALLKDVSSEIYSTASKGAIKKTTAGRYVSRLAQQVSQLGKAKA